MALGVVWTSALLCVFVAILSLDIMGFFRRKNNFDVDGRTVVITGGSQGMGRALAKLLAEKGANVVIVARNPSKLAEALQYTTSAAKNPAIQRFHTISADVTSAEENTRIIREVTAWNHGQPPDIVWANAGSAHPGLFADLDISTLRAGMDIDYWGAAYLAHATLKAWLQPSSTSSTSKSSATAPSASNPGSSGAGNKQPRHFIMTSSVLAFVGIAGYAAYSPAKAAMRSLADTLRQEIALYSGSRRRAGNSSSGGGSRPPTDVRIHCVHPGTITTPGFEEEEKIKHPVTKLLESGDPRQTAEEVAAAAVRGLEKGEFLITTNLLGRAMRVSSLGGAPRSGFGIIDTVFSWVTSVAWLFVGPDMEGKVFDWGKGNEVRLPAA